jgi:hypothetical protein
VAQPSNPVGFAVNRRKPRMQTSVMSHYPAPSPIDDFILLFLPPCGPHLTPLSIGSLESGLLVSFLLGGPARHRPFAPTLHLDQRNQAATCTYNTRPRVNPHHVVNHSSQPGATIHRSLDAPVLSRQLRESLPMRKLTEALDEVAARPYETPEQCLMSINRIGHATLGNCAA